MKRTLNYRLPYEGNLTNFKFEYWPPIPATRLQPEEGAEINILEMTDVNGNPLPVPDSDLQETEWQKVVDFLLKVLENEYSQEGMETIAIEPWD